MDFTSFFASNSKLEFEALIDEALAELIKGNDGDAVYHPIYKAWRQVQANPSILKQAQNPSNVGMGFLIFLSYGTVSNIDERQQLASLAYLMVSKAIYDGDTSSYLYKNRILVLHQYAEAFNYTISSVVCKNDGFGIFFNQHINRICKPRDSNYKMMYSDLCAAPTLLNNNLFMGIKKDLDDKIAKEFFSPLTTSDEIRKDGENLHSQIYEYLVNKVFDNEDVDF